MALEIQHNSQILPVILQHFIGYTERRNYLHFTNMTHFIPFLEGSLTAPSFAAEEDEFEIAASVFSMSIKTSSTGSLQNTKLVKSSEVSSIRAGNIWSTIQLMFR